MRRWLPIAVSLLSGCALLSDVLQAAFQKPQLTFKTARVSAVTLDALTLDTVWQLDNPNSVGLSLKRADYRLSVEGKQVVAGSPPLGLTIPAAGSTELTFPATVRFADIVPVAEELTTKDFLHYRVEGTVGIDSPVGVLDFPLAYESQLETPKLPKVELQAPRVTRLSLQGATVEFPIALTNRNSFPLPLQGLEGRLSIAGHEVGSVSTADVGTLDPHGTKVVTVPLQIDLLNTVGAVSAALQGGSAQVQLKANLRSGERRIPIDVGQVLEFVR